MSLLLLLLLLSLLTSTHCSCGSSHRHLLSLAFSSVSNFHLPPSSSSSCLLHLLLPSQNLSGTLSWMFLRNITTLRTLDLSHNSLHGSIPATFWSSPSLSRVNLASNRLGGPLRFDRTALRSLNLSSNRFTSASDLSQLPLLELLDLSRNNLAFPPPGLNSLPKILYLDLSDNSMSGDFPADFPAIAGLRFLNLSYNNLTGEVGSDALDKFGSSAFAKGGIFTRAEDSGGKKARALRRGGAAAAAGVVIVAAAIAGGFWCRKKRSAEKKEGEEGEEEEMGWVREAKSGAEVVMFEKPLMELTFGDLAAASSGFGRESLMAEGGRRGPIYRAVLAGEMNVVVRVMESQRGVEAEEAAKAYREIGRLRHRNLLPLLGYCISGREKLLLYEYMERGDLHRWLHELPAGQPDVEEWTADSWENLPGGGDWPARHRIALGVARGLAFLHQGWVGSHAPVVHGHLVPSNILLSDDLEPRIADFGCGGGTAEDDVYSYGVVVMELVTGRSRWTEEEVERLRGVVREGPEAMASAVDRRLQVEAEWEREAVECLKVGYLCTAKSPEKRPTMRQVVALLKDIRPDCGGGDGAGNNGSPSY